MNTPTAVAVVLLVVAPVSAQSLNIDYGPVAVPTAGYAAAGLPGVWNAVAGGAGETTPLVNIAGRSTSATIRHDFGTVMALDDDATTDVDEQLVDDGLSGMGDVAATVTVEGLANGTYQLIVYGWTPTMPVDMTMFIIDGQVTPVRLTGGPWPGGLEADITHVVVELEVADGTMTVGAVGGYRGASGFLNGLQLRRLTPADLNGDGLVDVTDLLELLGVWGACPECPSDLDASGAVDVLDLLELLAHWG